ncbi:uncharacterized protein BO95DRAFT_459032 [Aspergillus brunneoviolaceus CBS 621.78]|uniref:Uncharacterized protein n=1 Tax=Aspergillus brunneoviolaceus CBS 621.78 TaxID=1450534 RepID=A0ACD1GMQ5_9EURO|nr:hypothetical protein BO95DRAFT_459032 [Aspergillus brunneoviolaceus CBS 621.78]RAH50546.1 hypothetical protein BO95DRAFT_459032 [Aspergillus brunneoviolaceus CBS 621.78]
MANKVDTIKTLGSFLDLGSGRIIGLFIAFGILFLCFITIQLYAGEKAILPPRLLRGRNIWGSALFSFCLNRAIFIFLPIWFQCVKGASATESGVMNLPLTLSNALLAMGSDLLVTAARYHYSPVFFGRAAGLGIQLPVFVVQTTLPTTDIPTAAALMAFLQVLGGAMFFFVGQNVFQNQLVAGLLHADLPVELDVQAVLGAGPAGLREIASEDTLVTLLAVYNVAVVRTFYVAVGLAMASVLGAAVVEWRPISKERRTTWTNHSVLKINYRYHQR